MRFAKDVYTEYAAETIQVYLFYLMQATSPERKGQACENEMLL